MESKRLAQLVTAVALLLALAHLIWPTVSIDAITIVLLIAALLPWLAPLFRSLECPGGWKFEFRELQKTTDRADAAGLLAPTANKVSDTDHTFQRVAEHDPNLALAGLRIEIERRLSRLASVRGIDVGRSGVGVLLRQLSERGVLDQEQRGVLSDMVVMLNQAVHGAQVDHRAAHWAIDVGPRLLKSLDDLIAETRG